MDTIPIKTGIANCRLTQKATQTHAPPIFTYSVTVATIASLWFVELFDNGQLCVLSAPIHSAFSTSFQIKSVLVPVLRTQLFGTLSLPLVPLLRPLLSFLIKQRHLQGIIEGTAAGIRFCTWAFSFYLPCHVDCSGCWSCRYCLQIVSAEFGNRPFSCYALFVELGFCFLCILASLTDIGR